MIDIVSESTFVSLRRIVGPITFWECTVAFGRIMTLDNFSGNFVFCAMSFKSQMTISSIKLFLKKKTTCNIGFLHPILFE